MVKAILDGRKTRTSRPIKPQPDIKYSNDDWYPDRYNHTDEWCFWGKKGTAVVNKCGLPLFKSPYNVDDILYVRETWLQRNDPDSELGGIEIKYRATDNIDAELYGGWRPSIHMPKWAARLFLEVTDVRAMRIQDLDPDSIREEGCRGEYGLGDVPGAFISVWNSIYAKQGQGWDANPWIWNYGFKVVDKPEVSDG